MRLKWSFKLISLAWGIGVELGVGITGLKCLQTNDFVYEGYCVTGIIFVSLLF